MAKLQELGFACSQQNPPKTFVSAHRLKEVRFDSKQHLYSKIYEEDYEIVPLQIIMRRRDNNHFLNVNVRCNNFA